MSVSIRPLNQEDETAWRRLWGDYLDFYNVTLTEADTEHLFSQLLNGSVHFGFVAEKGDDVVGFVHCTPHASTWAPQGYCYLEDLYVDPSARTGGVGRSLIERVYDEADKRGFAHVYWHTNNDNQTARRLYDKLATLSDFVQYRHSSDL